jgi:thioredoxin 1
MSCVGLPLARALESQVMLRKLFGLKPKPPTLPLEYRSQSSTITDEGNSTSILSIRDVVDAEFDEVVLQSESLVVVDFWAEWCQPCTIISAYTAWLVRDYGSRLLVAALDVDENPEIPERYTIMGLPTLLFFRDGVEVDRQVGLLTYEELQAKVEVLLAQSA